MSFSSHFIICFFLSFTGLGHLISCILINGAHYFKRISESGIKKMCRNIFILQQNLTNITMSREADLDFARWAKNLNCVLLCIISMPTMQLEGWYGEVKCTEVVIVIFTFPLCCVGGSAKIHSELSISSLCLCWVISVHVILLRPKLRQGNVSRYNCCVEFQLDEGGASDCPNELHFSLLKT